jgi:TolB-like protein
LSYGLVIWIGFTWVYNWSPQGFIKTEDLTTDEKITPPSYKSILMYLLFVVILIAGSIYIWKQSAFEPQDEIRSLAVLPFDNLSNDTDQEYILSGLQDNLITTLSKIQSIRTISKKSTMRYRNTDKSMAEIARELGVDALIESSVLKVGDSVRINIQLIQVFPEEKHIWAQIFNRNFNNDIFELFNELTQSISEQIQIELTAEQGLSFPSSKMVDPEAFKLYLKGKYYLEKLSKDGFDKALKFFEQSIAADASYAPVYAELANTYLYLLQMRLVPLNEALSKVYSYNNKALELDPNLPDANYTQALLSWFEWDWKTCERSFQQVLKTNPNHVLANSFYGHLLMLQDQFDLAIPHMERAVSLDPMNDLVLSLYGVVLFHNRQVDKAIEVGKESLELEPKNILTLRLLEFSSYQNDNQEASIEMLDILYSEIFPVKLDLKSEYELHGYKATIEKLAQLLEESSQGQDVYIAMFYYRAGNAEKAIEWIQRGYEHHDGDIPYFAGTRIMETIRDAPRILAILEKVGLP